MFDPGEFRSRRLCLFYRAGLEFQEGFGLANERFRPIILVLADREPLRKDTRIGGETRMLDMLARIGQLFTSRPERFKAKPRRALAVDQLESRELQAVISGQSALVVHPALLPNTGRYVNVHFFGALATNSNGIPEGFFVVTDEYRRVEPHGNVALTPLPSKNGLHRYSFDFTIPLQASRSTGTADGRHYNIFVGAKDPDNTDGRTVSVYVPKQLPKWARATI